MSALYGLLAEFDHPRDLLAAARAAHRRGYRRIDGFSPFPIPGLAERLGGRGDAVGWWSMIGGLAGAGVALTVQWYTTVVDYPLNVGGRPLAAWPAFVLPTFEMATLAAALAAAIAMLRLNGLPLLRHPLLALDEFHLASNDKFFLCIMSADPQFDAAETRAFLEGLRPVRLIEVPR